MEYNFLKINPFLSLSENGTRQRFGARKIYCEIENGGQSPLEDGRKCAI